MAELATTHETARPVEQWKCMACAEVWEIVEGESLDNGCPECRGPLRLISSPPSHRDETTERSLVALSDDQQWLVVHRADRHTPWTVLQRLDEIDGYGATGDAYPDTGQNAGEILSAFLATQRDRNPKLLHHLAAD